MNEYDHREVPKPKEGTRNAAKLAIISILILIVCGVGYSSLHIMSTNSEAVAKPSGADIYDSHCSACHQPNGQGLRGTFPPLAGSEWLQGNPGIPIAIVNDGLQGPIEVAGNTFQGFMPRLGSQLSDAELASVLSFARHQWGNTASKISPSTVAEHRARFGDRKVWSAEELKEVFGEP